MTAPAPVRVVVVGNSVSVLCRPHAEHGAGTYAATLTDACCEHGVRAEVWNQGRWFEQVHTARRRWDRDVSPFLPAVVVVNYGVVECQPYVAPHVVHRMILDWKTRTSRSSEVGRRVLVRPARAVLGRGTARWCRLVGQRTHKLAPERFREEIRRLVRSTRSELGAAVLVLGVGPPGPLEGWMPGLGERTRRYDAMLRDVVDGFDDERIQFVDVRALYEALGESTMSVDGLHYTPAGHRAIAGELARRIVELGAPSTLLGP